MIEQTLFNGIRVVGCERGGRPHHRPENPDDWEANFHLIFSGAPDKAWDGIFDSLRAKYFQLGELPNFFSSHVEEDRLSFFIHPLRLQSYVELIEKIVVETNQLYCRRMEEAQFWSDPEADFEEMIGMALTNLKLSTANQMADGVDEF